MIIYQNTDTDNDNDEEDDDDDADAAADGGHGDEDEEEDLDDDYVWLLTVQTFSDFSDLAFPDSPLTPFRFTCTNRLFHWTHHFNPPTNLSYKVCGHKHYTEASILVRLTLRWNPGPWFCSLNLWISFYKGIILVMLAHHENRSGIL